MEDDPLVRESVVLALGGAYEVLTWPRSAGLPEAVAAHEPDALVLGVSPRDEASLTVYRALRADPRTGGLPILALVPAPWGGLFEPALERWGDARLSKTFDPAMLLDAVATLLGR